MCLLTPRLGAPSPVPSPSHLGAPEPILLTSSCSTASPCTCQSLCHHGQWCPVLTRVGYLSCPPNYWHREGITFISGASGGHRIHFWGLSEGHQKRAHGGLNNTDAAASLWVPSSLLPGLAVCLGGASVRPAVSTSRHSEQGLWQGEVVSRSQRSWGVTPDVHCRNQTRREGQRASRRPHE